MLLKKKQLPLHTSLTYLMHQSLRILYLVNLVFYKLAVHCKPLEPLTSDRASFLFGCHGFTLKGYPKVKSDTTKRYIASNFLQVACILETSGSNNKWDRGTFKVDCHILSLKQHPAVNSNNQRYIATNFFQDGWILQTSGTNNMRNRHFYVGLPRCDLQNNPPTYNTEGDGVLIVKYLYTMPC